tara:strand:- start:7886 stop:8914 length:1029 start_codon:yes stop_codon:yes gene_type:complete
MAIHLSKDQVNQVLHADVYESNHGRDGYTRKRRDFAFLLFIEGDEPHADWSFWEKMIDTAVQAMQPPPAFTHVELFIPPDQPLDEVHFATYLGKDANWGSAFSQSRDFYLGDNLPAWRAIPIMSLDAPHRLRKEASKHVGTPYGNVRRLFNYPFSVPPLRCFSNWIDNSVGAPAHCASLTARCLSRALPEMALPHPSPWFGPSTLFLELTSRARMSLYKDRVEEMNHLRSLPENEEVESTVSMLLRGSDESVRKLDDGQCSAAMEWLSTRVVDAIVGQDTAMERLTQHQLGVALVRWSQVKRSDVVAHWETVVVATDAAAADATVPSPSDAEQGPGPGAFRH